MLTSPSISASHSSASSHPQPRPLLKVDLERACPAWPRAWTALIKDWANQIMQGEAANRPCHEQARAGYRVTILLSDNHTIHELNREWRGYDKPTNVLSFPSMPIPLAGGRQPRQNLGDIVIAYETCLAEATTQAKDLKEHLAHLVTHGILHLLGYDHEADDEAEIMEARERYYLQLWQFGDPYPEEITP